MNREHEIHDTYTKTISLKPHIIGLTGIVLSTNEANIHENGSIISQPDGLAFDPSTKTLYNIEYKCHDNKSRHNHGLYQLNMRHKALTHILPDWRIVDLLITGDYKLEKVR
jgi:hypothetical protein